ncbi:MAG: HlyD family secretion protein [Gammaproteobacteria bacterium]|jgi:membrane fusion protein (multidrug efflux system)
MEIDHQTLKKNILIGSIILVCLFSFSFWLYGKFYINTDDAYVNANIVQTAPRVTGKVGHLYVENNQRVNSGDLLFDLEPETFEASLAEAKAGLNIAEAKLKVAKTTADRTLELVNKQVASAQDGDIAKGNLDSAIASLDMSKAFVYSAELNLQYTKIYASTSGWVTNMTLRVGDSVMANQPLFALVSEQKFWVDANFKEDQLENIEIDQKADIKVDMYPNHHFVGIVESFSSGTGNAFSLLPPENATGNWVKVTQRVPVRIKIINYDPKYPLRVGTSATVSISVNLFKLSPKKHLKR